MVQLVLRGLGELRVGDVGNQGQVVIHGLFNFQSGGARPADAGPRDQRRCAPGGTRRQGQAMASRPRWAAAWSRRRWAIRVAGHRAGPIGRSTPGLRWQARQPAGGFQLRLGVEVAHAAHAQVGDGVMPLGIPAPLAGRPGGRCDPAHANPSARAASHRFCTAQTLLYRSWWFMWVRPTTTGPVRSRSPVMQMPTGDSTMPSSLSFWWWNVCRPRTYPAPGVGPAEGNTARGAWCLANAPRGSSRDMKPTEGAVVAVRMRLSTRRHRRGKNCATSRREKMAW